MSENTKAVRRLEEKSRIERLKQNFLETIAEETLCDETAKEEAYSPLPFEFPELGLLA
jgi:hypothetical protein